MEAAGRSRDVGYRLGELTEAIENLSKNFEKMEHKLFGNGREGILAVHSRQIKELEDTKTEHTLRKQMLMWGLRVVGGLLMWTWGMLVGNSNAVHSFLKSIGW